ncbi:De-etiolated protein 1 Det1-domain-containing protein [Umbelopsis sp. PMI_123]|nr:De-etiolated protein 1 Det1-domain-containing protein [Umbelopsis sp. PMI_123]
MATRPRKDQILFHTLRQREIGGKGRGVQSATILTRQLYSVITPNETLYKVELPDGFVPRRFTPDGKLLVGYNRQGDGIRVYSLRYPAKPLSELPSEITTNDTEHERQTKLEDATFSRYFKFLYDSEIIQEQRHSLCKDFCLVTYDHQYLILASSAHSRCTPEESRQFLCSLNSISTLMDTIFYSVDIQTGQVIDTLCFLNDYILLPQHAGVSLLQNLFAVMSVQNQTIHLYQIMGTGRLRKLRSMGWFNNEDEESLLRQHIAKETAFRKNQESVLNVCEHHGLKRRASMAELDLPSGESYTLPHILSHRALSPSVAHSPRSTTSNDTTLVHELEDTVSDLPGTANPDMDIDREQKYEEDPKLISGFRQKFMVYLYRKAANTKDNGVSLRHFYCNFDAFAQMKLWRIQLLSGNKILVKLNIVGQTPGRQTEGSIQLAVFVIYNMAIAEVESVFDNSSTSVLDFYEEHADILRGVPHDGITWHGSTYTNSELTKDALKRHIYVWRYAKNGGRGEAMRRLALSFPQCPQSYLESPYFDQSIFSFDDKFVSSLDGLKSSQGSPIKFYARKSGRMKFKLDPNPMPFLTRRESSTARRFTTYIPHPTLPFIISKQHVMMRPTIVNFHVFGDRHSFVCKDTKNGCATKVHSHALQGIH